MSQQQFLCIRLSIHRGILRQFSFEVILFSSHLFPIVWGLPRIVNNKLFLLSFGESNVLLSIVVARS